MMTSFHEPRGLDHNILLYGCCHCAFRKDQEAAWKLRGRFWTGIEASKVMIVHIPDGNIHFRYVFLKLDFKESGVFVQNGSILNSHPPSSFDSFLAQSAPGVDIVCFAVQIAEFFKLDIFN